MRRVPANCSRYFDKQWDAENQPIASINLEIDGSKMFVANTMFKEELIVHDERYCTTNRFQLENSLLNFKDIIRDRSFNQIVDIGCGQGEFVGHLKTMNLPAIGFDPILRNENFYLFKKYFMPLKENLGVKNIYTMRCVLPHLKNPFDFLEKILLSDEQALIYIEYQNLEWIIEKQTWQQISHDHVNYFSTESFSCDFNVLSKGVFGNSEWSYVLIDGKKTANEIRPIANLEKLIELESDIPALLEKQTQGMLDSINIYGAAGKGMLFAYELKKLGAVDVVAYDEEPIYWNKFLEASGTQVRNPTEITKLNISTNLIVMNPNHYEKAVSRYGDFVKIHI